MENLNHFKKHLSQSYNEEILRRQRRKYLENELEKKLENQRIKEFNSFIRKKDEEELNHKKELMRIQYHNYLNGIKLQREKDRKLYQDEMDVDEKTQAQLIYKNKTLDKNGTVVAEEKYKTTLESKVATEQILKSAGLVPYCKLLQTCYIFSNSNFEFALQVVEGLGMFVEAEENKQMKNVKKMKTLPPMQKIDMLKTQVNSLGLNLGTDYSCKKPYMLLHKNKQ